MIVSRKWIMDLCSGLQFQSRTNYGVLFTIKMFITSEGQKNQDNVSISNLNRSWWKWREFEHFLTFWNLICAMNWYFFRVCVLCRSLRLFLLTWRHWGDMGRVKQFMRIYSKFGMQIYPGKSSDEEKNSILISF